MPFEIGKLSKGLASILALRMQGKTPGILADQVVQTVEGLELFLLDNRVYIQANQNVAPVVGGNVFPAGALPNGELKVPAGELWYVWALVISVTNGGATAIDICGTANLDGNPIQVPVTDFEAAAINQHVRVANRGGFWAGPGSQLGFAVRSVTGAPVINGSCVVSRLRV